MEVTCLCSEIRDAETTDALQTVQSSTNRMSEEVPSDNAARQVSVSSLPIDPRPAHTATLKKLFLFADKRVTHSISLKQPISLTRALWKLYVGHREDTP